MRRVRPTRIVADEVPSSDTIIIPTHDINIVSEFEGEPFILIIVMFLSPSLYRRSGMKTFSVI